MHTFPNAVSIARVVKEDTDIDLLGTRPHKWTANVSLPNQNKIGEDLHNLQHRHKRFMIKQGFADGRLTKTKPQTTYGGCDTRDVYYHGWDVSHETTPPRDKERQYQIERAFLLDKTSRTADNIIHKGDGKERTVYGINTRKHIKPEEISMAINEKLRVEKEEDQNLWKEFLVTARYQMPSASQEKLNATVYKWIQHLKHGKKEDHDPELTFKPDCSVSQWSKAPLPAKTNNRFAASRAKEAMKATD